MGLTPPPGLDSNHPSTSRKATRRAHADDQAAPGLDHKAAIRSDKGAGSAASSPNTNLPDHPTRPPERARCVAAHRRSARPVISGRGARRARDKPPAKAESPATSGGKQPSSTPSVGTTNPHGPWSNRCNKVATDSSRATHPTRQAQLSSTSTAATIGATGSGPRPQKARTAASGDTPRRKNSRGRKSATTSAAATPDAAKSNTAAVTAGTSAGDLR